MSNIMRQLRQDHRNVDRLLKLLDEQIGTLQAADRTDFELMQDAMQYMTYYPDRYHHPTEDLVFERLAARDASAREAVDELLEEHRLLAERGGEFLESLRTVVDGAMVAREPLEAQGKAYVDLVRRHMHKEESRVFPWAERALSEEDWRQVEEAQSFMQDPLFGPVVDDDYRALYELVTKSSE